MSEDNKILGDLPNVGFKDAAAFFSQRTDKPCPACGHSSWNITATLHSKREGWKEVSLGLPSVNLQTGESGTQAIPFVLALCKKCAFVRMHGLTEIARWIKDGKPEFKDDE